MNVEVHPEVAPWSVLLSAPTWETEKTSGILGTKIKDSKSEWSFQRWCIGHSLKLRAINKDMSKTSIRDVCELWIRAFFGGCNRRALGIEPVAVDEMSPRDEARGLIDMVHLMYLEHLFVNMLGVASRLPDSTNSIYDQENEDKHLAKINGSPYQASVCNVAGSFALHRKMLQNAMQDPNAGPISWHPDDLDVFVCIDKSGNIDKEDSREAVVRVLCQDFINTVHPGLEIMTNESAEDDYEVLSTSIRPDEVQNLLPEFVDKEMFLSHMQSTTTEEVLAKRGIDAFPVTRMHMVLADLPDEVSIAHFLSREYCIVNCYRMAPNLLVSECKDEEFEKMVQHRGQCIPSLCHSMAGVAASSRGWRMRKAGITGFQVFGSLNLIFVSANAERYHNDIHDRRVTDSNLLNGFDLIPCMVALRPSNPGCFQFNYLLEGDAEQCIQTTRLGLSKTCINPRCELLCMHIENSPNGDFWCEPVEYELRLAVNRLLSRMAKYSARGFNVSCPQGNFYLKRVADPVKAFTRRLEQNQKSFWYSSNKVASSQSNYSIPMLFGNRLEEWLCFYTHVELCSIHKRIRMNKHYTVFVDEVRRRMFIALFSKSEMGMSLKDFAAICCCLLKSEKMWIFNPCVFKKTPTTFAKLQGPGSLRYGWTDKFLSQLAVISGASAFGGPRINPFWTVLESLYYPCGADYFIFTKANSADNVFIDKFEGSLQTTEWLYELLKSDLGDIETIA